MTRSPLSKSLWSTLQVFRNHSESLGLNDVAALLYVYDHPQCPQKDLAQALGYSPPTVSKIVARLSWKAAPFKPGMALIDVQDRDRRTLMLELTLAGKALVLKALTELR